MPGPAPLSASALRFQVDPKDLPFETTEDLEALERAVGQDRALEAARFGLAMASEGFNLVVVGSPGVGRRTLLRAFIEQRAANEPVPDDICYVHDFDRPHAPRCLRLAPGRGRALKRDLDHVVLDLRTALPQTLEGDEVRQKRQAIENEEKEAHEARLVALKERGEARGVAVVGTQMGLAIVPVKEGAIVSPADLEKLPDEERIAIEGAMEEIRKALSELVDEVPRVQKRARDRVRALVRETAAVVVGHHLCDLRRTWEDEPAVIALLDAMERDMVENVGDFLKAAEGGESPIAEMMKTNGPFRRYGVNVIVDNGETKGAPIVIEDHPTHANLIGRVEHLQQLGALVTDFQLIKAGALHRANGGYLMLDAHKILAQPFAWESLKRCLRSKEVRIESPAQILSVVSTASLEPAGVELRVKVILLADPQLFQLLDALDPDARALFKVLVDFEEEIPRTAENSLLYARLVGTLARREGLPPLTRAAVVRLLEEATRGAGDRHKLSARVLDGFDLVREAAFFSTERRASRVDADDVEQAIVARRRRNGKLGERLIEVIEEGTFLIDTTSRVVGQVNGLAVLQTGRAAFGRPSRITAKVRLGRGEVIDVEREAELGGPIHTKGVMILSAFLGARYATSHPLSLSATLVFEQSYGRIEGDSASCAELCALLSALAEVPISQAIAITGSVNQHGDVQAIGGANEKIEGFFDLCARRGLSADAVTGVLLPRSNVRHLQLRRDVIDAVEQGLFRIWPISTVDEAIEALTGVAAGVRIAPGDAGASTPLFGGARGEEGQWTEGSVNARVEARLVALAQRRLDLGKETGAEKKS